MTEANKNIAEQSDALIEVKDLKKTFGDNEVLKGITTTVRKGEKVVVIGPSGSGKSTFLRCLNCMEDPTSGSIIFHGVDIANPKVDINVHRQKMGMVFQHFNLFNNKTVLENIMLAPIYVGKKARRKKQTDKSVKQIKQEAEEKARDEELKLKKSKKLKNGSRNGSEIDAGKN